METFVRNPRHDGGCIYCGSNGPFSDEHVVPAGLGGEHSEIGPRSIASMVHFFLYLATWAST